MNLIDIFRIAISTFTHNKMRTFLTIFGVAIGIGAIVFLLSLGYGLQEVTISEITSAKALSTLNVTSGNTDILPLNDAAKSKFAKLSNVESADENYTVSGQAGLSEVKTDILINAVSANYLDLESPQLQEGSYYTSDNDKNIVLTSLVASAFNKTPKQLLGQKIKMTMYIPSPQNSHEISTLEKEYTVSGIIKDTTMSYCYLPIKTVTIPEGSGYSVIKLKVNDTANLTNVKNKLTDMGYKVNSLGEKISDMNKIFNYVKLALIILGAIALFVASIGMFNTLTISLLERTRDIGIMKSLGATDQEIHFIFLTESTLIGLFGGLFGIVIALILGNLINLTIYILASKAGGEAVKIFQAPVSLILIIVAFSLVVGILTGIYPARRAAKINPLDALRYE